MNALRGRRATRRRPGDGPSRGLTMAELLITVVVLGLLSATAIRFNEAAWRREQANAVAKALAIWLEEVARSPDQNGNSCQVTINSAAGSLAPGSQLASVSPASCAGESILRVPGILQSRTVSVAAQPNQWSFTPRGAIATDTSSSGGSVNKDGTIQVGLAISGGPPLRCVRLTGALGLIRIGRNNSSDSASGTCTEWSTL